MVIASRRRLRPRPSPKKVPFFQQVVATAFLVTFIVAWGWQIYKAPVLWLTIITVFVILGSFLSRKAARQLAQLRSSRPSGSICTFVRQCDYRNVDLLALRAVYEELRECMDGKNAPFPIHPGDRLESDLLIDPEDLEDMAVVMAVVMAARAGRSLEGAKANPFYAKVKTPFDLIRFLSHQPRA